MGYRLHDHQGGEGGADLSALRFPHARPRGFSLLELLITVVIVSILASIALPNFAKAIEQAKVKDGQTVLAAIASAERIYRLDQGSFGSFGNLTVNRYVSDPDAGNQNENWNFAAVVAGGGFTATATRTGSRYNGNTIVVDQNYTGAPIAGAPYNGRTYAGNHPLRD